MNKSLLREQEKFEAVFQNASLGILVINNRGEIILANNFLLSQFGYINADELIGKKMEILIPQRYHKNHEKDRDKFIAHPSTRPMGIGRDLFGVKKDGTEMPLEISLSSYNNDQGVFSIAFISDISARIEVQTKIKEQQLALSELNKKMEILNEDLEKKVAERTLILQKTLQKLEASKDELSKALSKEKDLSDLKSGFVSMASHEFRTPLSTILSSASLLAKYELTEEQPKRDKHIQRIKSSVINLNNILNEFLSIGKIEEGKITSHAEFFDIKDFITNLYTEMSELFKEGQKIDYTHEGETIVYLDGILFKNVLINLLSNAAKFSAENSTIYMRSSVKNKMFHFHIRDEGIGISKKDQTHLFTIFFRGLNAVNISGTGLGLHIVSKYIEMMEGTLELKSELNVGTELNLTFAQ
ncbi:MAG: ATP-binding protein [Ginsengibacter sp.]